MNDCTVKNISYMIEQLHFKPVKIGSQEFRAVAIMDPWNAYRLREDEKLVNLWRSATERTEKNKALYGRDRLVLEDILFLPTMQLQHFRPTVQGGNIVYGAGMNRDPRAFVNQSSITPTIVLGAGALLRGHRKDGMWFTVKEGDHGKGASYCLHYHDGWTRNEWYTKDGREEMANDSSLIVFNYDNGPMSSRA